MLAEPKFRTLLKKQERDAEGNISVDWINEDLITFVKDRLGHDQRYGIDPSKIKADLGWYPETDFETGIVKTIRWNLENHAWIEAVSGDDYQSTTTRCMAKVNSQPALSAFISFFKNTWRNTWAAFPRVAPFSFE